MDKNEDDFLEQFKIPKSCPIIYLWETLPQATKNYLIQKFMKPNHGKPRTLGPDPAKGIKFSPEFYGSFEVSRRGTLFKKKRNYKLHTYRWPAKKGTLKGVMFMFHGLNAYSDHGAHIAKHFAQEGIQTVAYDALGFGRSQAQDDIRGYVQNLEVLIQDARDFIDHTLQLHKEYVKLPKFAIGLSMGGLTIYELVLRLDKSFDAVLLFSPAIMILPNEKIIKSIVTDRNNLFDKNGYCAYYIDKLHTQKYPVDPDQSTVSSNLAAIKDMKADKLNILGYAIKSSAKMLFDIMVQIPDNSLEKPPERVLNFDVPFCYFQGGKDMLVNPDAQNILISHAQSKGQSEIHYYEYAMHDLWHEQEIEEMIPISINFVKKFLH